MRIHTLLFMFILFGHAESWEKGSRWEYCECEWLPWLEWSRCTHTCSGGKQIRERWLSYKADVLCMGVSDCADTNIEVRDCGATCLNNGTFIPGVDWCVCLNGYSGTCCEKEIFCPSPRSITNGWIEGSHYGYRSNITYVCNDGYSYGNSEEQTRFSRECNINGKWTEEEPNCQYIRSCSSNPCMNKAKCIDIPGTYKCECLTGWTGRNCDTDIQAPVIEGCPNKTAIISEKNVTYFRWKAPRIYDPLGFKVDVKVRKSSKTFSTWSSENLTAPVVNLPWGVHRIEYSAVKPTNGMTATCNFSITAKPVPCKGIPPTVLPLVCNNWSTNFFRLCKPLCPAGQQPQNADSFRHAWYNCLSKGEWSVPMFNDTCDKPTTDKQLPVLKRGCRDDKNEVGWYYVRELRKSSSYSDLCHFGCLPQNVEIFCGEHL